MNAVIRCTEDKFHTDICKMAMDYSIWIYNCIPDIQSGIYAI